MRAIATATMTAALILGFAGSGEARKIKAAATHSCETTDRMLCGSGVDPMGQVFFMPVMPALRNSTAHAVNKRKARRVSLNGVVAPLAAKVRQIQAACGSTVISAVRHTYVAGTRKISLHASGRAVDIAGNPACIYRQLAGWPGGYTTDYHGIKPHHVHISYGGSEHGLRFTHGSGKSKRYAKQHRHRLASAR